MYLDYFVDNPVSWQWSRAHLFWFRLAVLCSIVNYLENIASLTQHVWCG
jgi:hypothetical protein